MSTIEQMYNEFKCMEYKLNKYEELVGKLEDIEKGDFSYLFNKFKTLEGYKSSTGVRGIKIEKHYKGKYSKKWKAQIKVDYKNISLGYFDNMLDALNCRLMEEVRVFGEIKNKK